MRHKILLFYILIVFSPSVLPAQNIDNELLRADSLFQNKKFTQSLEMYDQLYNSGYYTPAMLLKMAYIHEGLEEYAQAIFYLSKLNALSPSDQLQNKIQTMAVNHELEGYEYSDKETLYHYLNEGITISRYVLLIILCGLLTGLLLKKKSTLKFSIVYIVVAVLYSTSYFIDFKINSAVIWKKNTYVLSAASSAADVMDILPVGQRVKVKSIGNVWVELTEGENSYFIKKSNLKLI